MNGKIEAKRAGAKINLTWKCSYCPKGFSQFKNLVTHYESLHKEQLKRYQIHHKKRGGQGIIVATSQEEACKFLGWRVDECNIEQISY